MFDRLNPFKKRNPLDQLTIDELRVARIKLERGREKVLKQISELEERKAELFDQGVHSDPRVRKDIARRIKETEEEIRHLDQQLVFYGKQLQIVNRLTFIKDNRDRMIELGIDKVLNAMDTGELRKYIEEISLTGAVNGERLDEVARMLEEALGTEFSDEEDPEIARLMEEMERAAMERSERLEVPEEKLTPPQQEPPAQEPPSLA